MVRRALPADRQVLRITPERTCIGCRKRAPASELLRIVAVVHSADQVSVVPDPARSRPGRGAHLHRDPACLALAQRRRAFARALRVTGVVDTGELGPAVIAGADTTVGGRPEPTTTSKVGRPT